MSSVALGVCVQMVCSLASSIKADILSNNDAIACWRPILNSALYPHLFCRRMLTKQSGMGFQTASIFGNKPLKVASDIAAVTWSAMALA